MARPSPDWGGGDTLNGSHFTGIVSRISRLTSPAATIQNFVNSDMFDFTDMNAATTTVKYTGNVVTATDGTHTVVMTVGFVGGSTMGFGTSSGTFHIAGDGASGTRLTWA